VRNYKFRASLNFFFYQNHDVKIAIFSLAGLYRLERLFPGNGLPRQTSQMKELAQKQSLLIASPSGREARTQDHLESTTDIPQYTLI
jgi:hypothetical protein